MARAFVCGCLGTALNAGERAFLKEMDPLGVILFKRNISTPEQVIALTSEIRWVLGREDAFVLIDQEGGRVQRLGAPHWRRYPSAARFATSFPNFEERVAAVKLTARLIAADLRTAGIDVDCLPVLDVPVEGSHDVIGDRAYSRDPDEVAKLGRAAAEGLLDGGVLPIMKHVPGHGRAGADSHLDLPIVISNIVRGAIGFDGLLFSDDLSMKALPGTFTAKTEALFAAGVDIALHCNGDQTEAEAVASASPLLQGDALTRVERALAARRRPVLDFDPVDAAFQLQRVLAAPA
jgi:beta-N-acetylhexosaminidase